MVAVWRSDRDAASALSDMRTRHKGDVAVVTTASEGSDEGGASPQIVSTAACREEAQLDPQREVS